MGLRAAVLAGLAAAFAAGCAPRVGLVRREPVRKPPRGARADFPPGRLDDVFAKGVKLVRERGLEIDRCERGRLTTAAVELDAPCGGTTCLAREITRVNLGHRRARVTVTREVWDPSLRAWVEQDDPSTVSELSRTERELVAEMVTTRAPPRRRERQREDPCAPMGCRDGTCVVVSAAPAR
jgi:hypothetical protein